MARQLMPQHEAQLERIVAINGDQDRNEMISEAFTLLEQQARLKRLRDALAIGIAEADRGDVLELTPEVWDEIDREVDEAILRGEQPNPDVCP